MKRISNMDKIYVIINSLLILLDIFMYNMITLDKLAYNGNSDYIIMGYVVCIVNMFLLSTGMIRETVKGDKLFAVSNMVILAIIIVALNVPVISLLLFPTTIQGIVIFFRRMKQLTPTDSYMDEFEDN